MVAFNIFVRIPISPRKAVIVSAPDLHKSDAPFEQPARGEALLAEMESLFVGVDFFIPSLRTAIDSIQSQRVLGLSPKIERFGSRELHFRRQARSSAPDLQASSHRRGLQHVVD